MRTVAVLQKGDEPINRAIGPYAVVVLAAFAWIGSGGCDKPESTQARSTVKGIRVHSRDIPLRVHIIGIFGRPLGSLITIRGNWVYDHYRKDVGLYFQVTDVDGRAPEDEIELADGVSIKQVFPSRLGRGPRPDEVWDWKYKFRGSVPSPPPTEGEIWEMLGVELARDYGYSWEAQ